MEAHTEKKKVIGMEDEEKEAGIRAKEMVPEMQ